MNNYRIFGSEMSPYSVKVRAYFSYKKIPYDWIVRSPKNQTEFNKLAVLPLIPLVVGPSGNIMQDSTPIIEELEVNFPVPSIYPESPELYFLSALIEEYGDEWANKLMFHARWWHDVDQASAARILGINLADNLNLSLESRSNEVRQRMVGRREFVGSSGENAPLIEQFLHVLLTTLENHLENRKYLFGARPSFGDFGLAPQIYELSSDPTGGGILRSRASNTLAWAYRMLEPSDEGTFEGWHTLAPTLVPLLENIGELFLPWSDANAAALGKKQSIFTVDLNGQSYQQRPQKYHAKSLAVLKDKLRGLTKRDNLDQILEDANCLRWLI